MRVLSYNGVTFSTLGLGAGGDGLTRWTGPDVRTMVMPRRGYNPLHVGNDRGPRVLTVTFLVKAGFTVESTILNLLGAFDPQDDTERLLVGELEDSTDVQAYAAMGQFRGGENQVHIDFSFTDPIWRELTATTHGPVSWPAANPAVLGTPNSGKARANLNLTLAPTALDTATDVFGLRKTFTVTNNGDTVLRRFPFEVDLGNTSAYWPASTERVWLFLNGVAQPRDLIAPREAQSWLWLLIDELGPGDTYTYEIATDAASDGASLVGSNRIAFDTTWEKNTATAGSTTTITNSGATWRTNQWRRGQINIIGGTGAGQMRKIASNTGTVITHDGAVWSPAPTAGSVFLLTTSHNDRWVYCVTQEERNNLSRGLWYQNKGQDKPSSIVFDTPGGWYRSLLLDNNDEKNQTRTYGFNVGGGDTDWFNGLEAKRTAQGWAPLLEEGQADSVAFSSPIEIDAFRFDGQFMNPNAVCRAKFGSRESGAEDWEWGYENATDTASLTSFAIQELSFTTDVRHLIAHLGPVNDEVVPVSWKRDTGSRTGGGSTTLQDDTKVWATDQWKNGRVRIVAGTGVGQVRTVTTNTSTTLTVSAWTTNPSDDSRFEVVNKPLVAHLRHYQTWEVRLNTAKVTHSAISADIFPNYNMQGTIYLAGGPDLTAPYQRIRFGLDGRYIQIAGTEDLRIDGNARRAGIYTTSTGVKVKDVSAAIKVQNRETDGNFYLAPEWLLIPPTPTNLITNPDFPSNITGWVASTATGGVTHTVTHDAALGHLANGSLKIQVTASAAGIGATATARLNGELACVAGRPLTITAWGRSDNRNWVPVLGFQFFDAGLSLVSTAFAGASAADYVHTVDTWLQIGFTAMTPATAAFARPFLIAYQRVATSLDSVWFDEIRFDTSALFVDDQGQGITANLTATATEGYHG